MVVAHGEYGMYCGPFPSVPLVFLASDWYPRISMRATLDDLKHFFLRWTDQTNASANAVCRSA